ncbi:hypothetical protein GO495_06550 [Chitinophaga oryziterrae]|uniref:Uncharacterized protein n=1 Tax=Chitinophaga oryziterrae TaxID=1031224 RepID=A0A6N8J5N0_9BACT|nr:hypothetical protein [Chitinophaga oryziterrae]MVT40234.1 hypothetical protein [Chitinophaga oryziterrae]
MLISKDSTIVEKATEFFWLFPDEVPVFIKWLQMHCCITLLHRQELKNFCSVEQIGRYNFHVLSAQRTLETIIQYEGGINQEIEIFAFSLFDWLYGDFVVNFLKCYGDTITENRKVAAFISEYFG